MTSCVFPAVPLGDGDAVTIERVGEGVGEGDGEGLELMVLAGHQSDRSAIRHRGVVSRQVGLGVQET